MASSADPTWEGLTASSKAAVRWAAAFSSLRRSTTPPDVEDLVAGIMLAHPRDSPARQAAEHFGIPPGTIIGTGPVPDRIALLAAFNETPTDRVPPVHEDLAQVLAAAAAGAANEPDGLVSLRVLFGAVLAVPSTAVLRMRDELNARGVDPDPILLSYNDFLAERQSYADFLDRTHPYRPPTIELPPYERDEPPSRTGARPPDLVGIGPEVDAFAHLIASRQLVPPLAIGLFGDWGGGKSYFQRSVQRRVDELISTPVEPAATPPFHRSVVQVEYNAWQYVEGDLWSSLLDHLFRNLGPAIDGDDLLALRQQAVIDQLRRAGDEHDAARLERAHLEEQLRVAAAEVRREQQRREARLAELEERRRDAVPRVAISAAVRSIAGDAVKRAGLVSVATEADDLRTELNQAGEIWRRAGAVLGPIRTGGALYGIAVVVLLGLAPAVAWVLELIDTSTVTATAGATATLLAGMAGVVRVGNSVLNKRLNEIADVRQKLDDELEAGRADADTAVAAAERRLDEADAAVARATVAERALGEAAAELEVTLASTTPERVLGEFLSERLGSDDYRKRLGIPALVRRDLSRLSTLIEQRNAQGDPNGEGGIDRVVLYIDDLDRCPARFVVDVLQAVHLLLAFPLFVVVVAVDARWVAQSLRDHYDQFESSDASPEDFIEKIFQIPFWVRPMDPASRRRMLTGLVATRPPGDEGLVLPARLKPDAIPDDSVFSAADAEFDHVVRLLGETTPTDPPWLEAATLTISSGEREWMERVAPLLPSTPRAVKRFANVYLLLCSVGRGRGRPAPDDGRLVVLLALATGYPALADEVLVRIDQADDGPLNLAVALAARGRPTEPPDRSIQRAAVRRWLDAEPDATAIDLADLKEWTDLIRRFRFRR